jgi:hypothetical protein
MIPAPPKEGANMENLLTIYLLNCRMCGERFSLTEHPGSECFVGGEPGWIVTCERCSQTTVYGKSEARIAQSSWSAV